MRITFVVPLLEVSGGARIIAGHAQRLAARGHDVCVVVPRPGRYSLKQRAKAFLGLAKLPDPYPAGAPVATADVRLHFVTSHWGPIEEDDVPDADVIIATWWETAEWIRDFSSSKGTKVYFIQHYEAFPEMPVDRVDAVWRLPYFKIAIAQWLVDLGRDRFGITDMALVPNAIDDLFFQQRERSRGEPTVGFLFHNAGFKDVATTIAAVKRLKQERSDVHFVTFGSVTPQAGELPPDVEFHHLPTRDQIASIYARCHAWLSTSRSEGFNLPPLEAMATGCPAVCAKTGRPFEIIDNGVNGYVVEEGDVAGFAAALARILDLTDAGWKSMSDAARRSVAYPTWAESNALFESALVRAAA